MAEINNNEAAVFSTWQGIVDRLNGEGVLNLDQRGQWLNEVRSVLLKVDLNATACKELVQMLYSFDHESQGAGSYRELRSRAPVLFNAVMGVCGKYDIIIGFDVYSYADGSDRAYINLGYQSSPGGDRKYEYAYESAYGTVPSTVTRTLDVYEFQYALTTADLPTLTADGYVFKGWTIDGTSILSVGDGVWGGETLTAVWEEEPTTVDYTISYETAYGTAPASKTVTVNEGESYALTADDLPTLTAYGYIFKGWTANGTAVSVGDTISTDTTLTAVWRKVAIITYHSEHGIVPEPASVVLDAFGELPIEGYLPELEAEGYIFKGWGMVEGEVYDFTGYFISGDIDLYAVWEEVVKTQHLDLYIPVGNTWVKKDLHKTVAGEAQTYLYNGVRLPDINEVWDKTAYPYAVVRVDTYTDFQSVSFCSVPFHIHPTNPNEFVTNSAVSNNCCYTLSNGSWVFGDANVNMSANWLQLDSDDVIWTSHDIIKPTDNSLFLAASDPVPGGGAEWQKKQVKEAYKQIGGKWVKIAPKSAPTNWLTFSSAEPFTIGVNNATKNWDGTLYYSTDTTTWSEWDGTTVVESKDTNGEHRIYMSGSGNSVITDGNRWVFTGSNIACTGNIENLLDYETVANGEHPVMGEYCYRSMFNDCAALTTAPELPATTLSNSCYSYMFYNCVALTRAPELPATTLASSCYYSMFERCSSLTAAPKLPATILASNCYYCMFELCTSLTTAPALPATTLASACYQCMFYDCTALATAPELPATILADSCYRSMFNGCTALTTAPELPVTDLVAYCYSYMFQNCTGLVTAPELPAVTLADTCYRAMFYNCTSLTTAPELPATSLADNCYRHMFYNCTSLITIPKLSATTLKTYCYYYMFNGCTNIKLSTTKTGSYQTSYRIPTSGTGTDASMATYAMFANTGGTFTYNSTGYTDINTTYYTANEVA